MTLLSNWLAVNSYIPFTGQLPLSATCTSKCTVQIKTGRQQCSKHDAIKGPLEHRPPHCLSATRSISSKKLAYNCMVVYLQDRMHGIDGCYKLTLPFGWFTSHCLSIAILDWVYCSAACYFIWQGIPSCCNFIWVIMFGNWCVEMFYNEFCSIVPCTVIGSCTKISVAVPVVNPFGNWGALIGLMQPTRLFYPVAWGLNT